MDNQKVQDKELVKGRLQHLMEESEDPYYDQYLSQMLRDLESGKASPAQVEQEANRSYQQYRQRMAQRAMAEAHARRRQEAAESQRSQSSVEMKVGVHVFSFLGAALILTAFVIFGLNFLNGLAQGLCLYGAALLLVLLSELLLGRKSLRFSHVLTGIGIGGLYIANIVNYLVLHTIPVIGAMAVTLLIGSAALLISQKAKSATLRLVSLLGCYISFLPVQGFGTEFHFLIAVLILLIINVCSISFPTQETNHLADCFHVLLHVLFTVILTSAAWRERLDVAYLVLYVVTSFGVHSFLCLKRSSGKENLLFVFAGIGNTVCIFILFLLGYLTPGMYGPEKALFIHLLAEVLIAAVSGIVFLLWNKEDSRRWIQIYYIAGTVLLLSLFTEYPAERLLSVLFLLLLGKLLAGRKEMQALDCIAVTYAGIVGLWVSDEWYCWLLVGALLISVVGIKRMHIYHEIVITLSILAIWWSQCEFYLHRTFGFHTGWLCPVSVGILFFLFLLFHHISWLKNKNQKPYNVVSIVLMALYCLAVWFNDDYRFSSMMMVLGAIIILVVFRVRYGMAIRRKYLLLAGYLVYFTLTGHYQSPVIVSILLMMIALGCVGIGFKQRDKAERVCGLVMAFFTCVKLVLYDFREVEVMYRTIVFLVVGMIALIISFTYIQLEKNMEKPKDAGWR